MAKHLVRRHPSPRARPLGVQLALLVVTLPLVIRTVQPVLLELDQAEEAYRIFDAREATKIVLTP